MAQLTVVATIIAKEDKVEFLKKELLKLVELTKTEQGCIGYTLHQDNENPAHFLMYENWESEELLEVHKNNTALTQFVATTQDSIAQFIVNKMTILA